jgi:hypothetical protein
MLLVESHYGCFCHLCFTQDRVFQLPTAPRLSRRPLARLA